MEIMKKAILSLMIIASFVLMNINTYAQYDDDMVRVYRWYSSVDKNYVTLAEGEIQEGQLLQWKYKEKTLLFYGYKSPGPDRVAVYRWTNPVTKDQVSVAEDFIPDAEMMQQGYTLKSLQFYAPIRRHQNHVAVYNWYNVKGKDWVTVPEFGDTDKYTKKGWKSKTFQFYGVLRNEK